MELLRGRLHWQDLRSMAQRQAGQSFLRHDRAASQRLRGAPELPLPGGGPPPEPAHQGASGKVIPKPVRIGIVGCGNVLSAYWPEARKLAQRGEAEVVV